MNTNRNKILTIRLYLKKYIYLLYILIFSIYTVNYSNLYRTVPDFLVTKYS